MKLQIRLSKSFQLRNDFARMRILHHSAAYDRIAGMKRDIERAHPASNNAIELTLVKIGQRNIVAHDERHAPVVVLYVQA